MLHDEVWRLEKIGKDGAFHKKLTSEGIKTVQDFLKLSIIDPHRLRKVPVSISSFIFFKLKYSSPNGITFLFCEIILWINYFLLYGFATRF